MTPTQPPDPAVPPDPQTLWPALSGTAKQVAWATKIRRQAFERFQHDVPTKPEGRPTLLDYSRRFGELLRTQTDAAWWIGVSVAEADPQDVDWAILVGGTFARQHLLDAVFEPRVPGASGAGEGGQP